MNSAIEPLSSTDKVNMICRRDSTLVMDSVISRVIRIHNEGNAVLEGKQVPLGRWQIDLDKWEP